MKKLRISDKISDTMGIPRDVISDVSRIVIMGNGIVHIEGFRGIAEYESGKISVKVKDGICTVSGEELSVAEITEEYINLKGKVKTVEFM